MKKILFVFFLAYSAISVYSQYEWVIISTIPSSKDFYDIYFADNNLGWAVGADGVCFKSTDGGYNWLSLNTGVTDNLYSVVFFNELIGYASGDNGRLIKTTNGGQSWSIIPTGETSLITVHVLFDPNRILIQNGIIPCTSYYKMSCDGGLSWSIVNLPGNPSRIISSIHFINSSIGYLAANDDVLPPHERDSVHIYKTIDGGINWSLLYSEDGHNICNSINSVTWSQVFMINQNIGYCLLVYYAHGYLLKTTDGGLSWNFLYDNIGDEIYFHNENVGWLFGGGMSDLRKTYDGGITFMNVPNAGIVGNFTFRNNPYNSGWAIRHNIVSHYEPLEFVQLTFFTNVTPPPSNINNIISPGKIVRFKALVKNQLSINLLTLSGNISTTNPYVTILNGTGIYNNVQAGCTGWNANEFEIQLANNIPDNEVITFDIILNDQIVTWGPWITSFSFPVVFNPFDVSNNIIDDDNIPDSNGNSNNIVEPNETIEIIPLMKNTTSHNFSNIEGYLFSIYPEIHIWNDTMGVTEIVYNHYTYGNLNIGATNVPPEKDFVFTDKFSGIYNLPFSMIMTGYISSFNGSNEYQDIEFRWGADFIMNDGYPNPPLGINDPEKFNEIMVFPNPANNTITIYTRDIAQNLIELIDVSGKTVIFWSSASTVTNLDVSTFKSGLYIIKITTDKGVICQKIAIE